MKQIAEDMIDVVNIPRKHFICGKLFRKIDDNLPSYMEFDSVVWEIFEAIDIECIGVQ
jgi:hypothetical protein